MRVFLDTNVLASAFATRGRCADVVRYVLGSHTLLVSSTVLEELGRVLRDKFAASPAFITEAVALLEQDVVSDEPEVDLDLPIGDSSDLGILSSAVAARADLFVTGDKELQDLGRVGDMYIMSPRGFWEEINVHPGDQPERQ